MSKPTSSVSSLIASNNCDSISISSKSIASEVLDTASTRGRKEVVHYTHHYKKGKSAHTRQYLLIMKSVMNFLPLLRRFFSWTIDNKKYNVITTYYTCTYITFSTASSETFGAPGKVISMTLILSRLFCRRAHTHTQSKTSDEIHKHVHTL